MKSNFVLMILDLDGTLTKSDNLIAFSLFMLKKKNYYKFLFFFPLVLFLKLGIIDNRKFKILYAKWILKNMSVQAINANVEKFIGTKRFKNSFQIDVLNLIQKQKKAEKIILSANYDFLVQPISEILNVPNQLSIKLEILNGKFTGKTLGCIPYGIEKIEAITPFLNNNSFSKTIGIADSISDIPLLKFLTEGIVVKYNKTTNKTEFKKI